MTLKDSPVAFLLKENLSHIARGNCVKLVIKTKTNADKDLGIDGTVTEVLTTIVPEPYLNAVPVAFVQRSGGSYRYSDKKMTASKDSLTYEQAMSSSTEFDINGERYQILTPNAGPTAYTFIIRQKASEPVIP
jgi:hypothetical protein